MCREVKVTVWNEFIAEKKHPVVSKLYPKGIHEAIADFLRLDGDITVRTATLDQDEWHGLSDEVLNDTDTLVWWGHEGHDAVKDAVVEKVYNRVLEGMGLIVLHSGHFSKIFRKLMGTTCNLKWRDGGKERVWVIEPGHPIAEGLPEQFVIPDTEMYGERFDIPAPETLVFTSWYPGGEIFRSGCCYTRGVGKIFYFSPGHETNPIYYQSEVQTVITNAVKWAAKPHVDRVRFGNVKPLEQYNK